MATTTRSTGAAPRRRRRASRTPTTISGFVCPREDLAGRVRERTLMLLDECLDTFELYRLVAATSDDRAHRRRALGNPDELRKALALGSDEYAAYHAAILQLRAECQQDPGSAAREMVALTIAHVDQDLR